MTDLTDIRNKNGIGYARIRLKTMQNGYELKQQTDTIWMSWSQLEQFIVQIIKERSQQ
jgi:hypothetical protein